MRGGQDYVAEFGSRMKGEGVWVDLIRQRFEKAAVRFDLRMRGRNFRSLDTSRFRRPAFVPVRAAGTSGSMSGQLDLF